VLTFGLDEQVGIITAVTESARAVGRRFLDALRWVFLFPLAATLIWLVLLALRTSRARKRPASLAVVRLGRLLERRGVALPVSMTVRGIGARAALSWPRAAADLDQLVRLAERERYGPKADRIDGEPIVRKLWAAIGREVRRTPPAAV